MKLRMHERSVFAILLRSPWWISCAIAVAAFAGLRLVIPAAYAFFLVLPFLVVSGVAGWRQVRAPSAEKVAAAMEVLRGMGWDEFSVLLEEAFRRDGYAVERLGGAAQADFELAKDGRKALVACKRWKAARTGVEPLRELKAAGEAREAGECLYVAAGELSGQARAYAAQNRIRLVEGAELARLARKG